MRHSNPPRATIDFETRSQCDIKKCGSWRYSLDLTTEILCLAFRLPHWKPGYVSLWHPAFHHLNLHEEGKYWELDELYQWIDDGGLIEAHNAWFERGIWANKMVPLGAPAIGHRQWRCSAAKAAAHALPRSLGDVADVLETEEQKDTEGEKLMKKLSKPRKPVQADYLSWYRIHVPCRACQGAGKTQEVKKDGTPKKNLSKCSRCVGKGHRRDISRVPPLPVLWLESSEFYAQLFDYCRHDVLTEEETSAVVPDLSPEETEIYLVDQAVNERGFQLDPEAIDIALTLIAQEVQILNAELLDLTDGVVERATQRDRMLRWFVEQGLLLENSQAATIDEALKRTRLSPHVRRGLELVRALGRSSTSKYLTMKRWMCPDGRVRGGLLFHGAGTGRWSGMGVQPHNFVKGKIKDMASLWTVLKEGTREEIIDIYDDVMTALSYALRGAITAASGRRLYVADFAAIEARVVLWLAEDEEALGIFRRGDDIYLEMASDIFGHICTKSDTYERALGKIAVLGLGFQMGWKKFIDTCAKFKIDISEEMGQKVVAAYRERFWLVKQMWTDMERAAIEAVEDPEKIIFCGRVKWCFTYGFLYCTLPSGRKLAYPEPEVHLKKTSWGEMKSTLTFMGVHPKIRQWVRLSAYGGLLVENIVQAVARDLMADAMLRCEHSGTYLPVLSVHDELIAEAEEDAGQVHEFETLMAACPSWATGLPIEASGWTGHQYRK